MYKVVQCYENSGIVNEHPINFNETFEEAYKDLLDVYKTDMNSFVMVLGLDKEAREYFVLNTLKNKDKDLLTIINA